MNLQYTNKDPRQNGKTCRTQVSGICHGFLKVSCISNKFDPHHQPKLVPHHQNISNLLLDQFKDGAIFRHVSQQNYQIYWNDDSSTVVLLKQTLNIL